MHIRYVLLNASYQSSSDSVRFFRNKADLQSSKNYGIFNMFRSE